MTEKELLDKTISVRASTKSKLNAVKLVETETYDSVINRLLLLLKDGIV